MTEQVLLNLTRNAIQAMETETALEDRVLTLRVRQAHPRWVNFHVIDRGPGIAANSWCHQRVVGYDFFPTFCRWAGVKAVLPTQLEGGDLTHLLSGSSDPVKRSRDPLVFHFPHYQGDSPHSAILSGHMKLIHFYETGENHLFDLKADIGESKNLAAAKPELTSTLVKQLADYLRDVGAEMPKTNPNFDPSKEPARKGGGKGGKKGGKKP
jgi:arylsulfatase A-like enzyme